MHSRILACGPPSPSLRKLKVPRFVDGREEVLHLYLRRSGTRPLTIIFRGKRSTRDLHRRPKKSDEPEWSWAYSFVPLLRSHEARWGRLRLSRDLCQNRGH